VAIATIGQRRQDLRILANRELAGLEGIGSLVIAVDPFGGPVATRANLRGLRQALRWLEGGGALLMFPAGEVSNLDLRTLEVVDRPWSAFNIDPDFGNTLDCLVLVDLRRTEPRVLQKYLSEHAWESFSQTHHRLRSRRRRTHRKQA
jgi:hypothetical protein